MGELIDVEECVRRTRRIAKRFVKELEVNARRADIRNVSHYFDDVRDGSAVARQISLDLVEGITALAENVSRIEDGADGFVFVFGAHAGEKNHCARARDGDDLGEAFPGPLTVTVIALFKIWHDIDLSRRHYLPKNSSCHRKCGEAVVTERGVVGIDVSPCRHPNARDFFECATARAQASRVGDPVPRWAKVWRPFRPPSMGDFFERAITHAREPHAGGPDLRDFTN